MVRTPFLPTYDWIETYRRVNQLLVRREEVYYNEVDGLFTLPHFRNTKGMKLLHYPKVGIYIGKGASHSWLWFVELLEKIGVYDIHFMDEHDIWEGGLRVTNIFLVGGGDTYAIAEGLNKIGADELRSFVNNGGTYMGSCAGAYLLLHLSGPPFTPFSNFTKVQMANVSTSLPECKCMPTKFYSPYNDGYVIHPVRESLVLEPARDSFFRKGAALVAPLYGGPAMVPSKGETALAHYREFTDDTIFLAEQELAQRMFIGNAAVIKKRLGKGTLWLFGPHFEHPMFPLANSAIVKSMYISLNENDSRDYSNFSQEGKMIDGFFSKEVFKALKREVSNSRIMALGLESKQIYWVIGKKSYEPEKIRVFLETVWRRLPGLMTNRVVFGRKTEFEELSGMFCEIRKDIKSVASGLQKDEDTTPVAERMFTGLKRATARFLDIYFRNKYVRTIENKNNDIL